MAKRNLRPVFSIFRLYFPEYFDYNILFVRNYIIKKAIPKDSFFNLEIYFIKPFLLKYLQMIRSHQLMLLHQES